MAALRLRGACPLLSGSEDRRPSAQCPVLGNSGQASFHPVPALDTKPRTGIYTIISMLNKTYISSMATF